MHQPNWWKGQSYTQYKWLKWNKLNTHCKKWTGSNYVSDGRESSDSHTGMSAKWNVDYSTLRRQTRGQQGKHIHTNSNDLSVNTNMTIRTNLPVNTNMTVIQFVYIHRDSRELPHQTNNYEQETHGQWRILPSQRWGQFNEQFQREFCISRTNNTHTDWTFDSSEVIPTIINNFI